MSRLHGDDDEGRQLPPGGDGSFEDPNYDVNRADWDDGGAAAHGLTAKAEAAGFSPVRFNKGRDHALDVDPRTKLPIINVPPERRKEFADMVDVVLHVFVDCFKNTSRGQFAERVLIITDQTLFLCTKDGAVSRCVMIDRVKALYVSNDSKALAITIPSEYDILLKFQNSNERDNVMKVLRTVFRRLSHARLGVERVTKKLDAASFKVEKPKTFRLALVPQKTRAQLRQALEVFEQEEETLLEEIDMYQDGMEARHQAGMRDLQAQLEADLQRLRESVKDVWDNEARLTKLRKDVKDSRRRIEEVDGRCGPDGEPPQSKDAKIAELELVVARLNASVYASSAEQARRGAVPGSGPNGGDTGNFFQKDLRGALYHPVWPGETGDPDLLSLHKSYEERAVRLTTEVAHAQAMCEQGAAAEARMRRVDERIAYLRHLQRTGKFTQGSSLRPAAGGGGSGVAASGNGASSMMGGLGVSSSAATYDATGNGGSYDWLAALPQEITEETITVDPRTGLHFVDVPPVMRPYFADASGAVLHFFAIVKKPSKLGELVKRVLLIGDQGLYLCTPSGVVKRCLDVLDVDEILLDTAFGIGFKCSADYDMCFTCATGEHRQEIVDIVQKLYKYSTKGRAVPVSEVPRHRRLEAFLRLQQPNGYEMRLLPFRSRRELVEAIRSKRDMVLHNAPSGGAELGSRLASPAPPGIPEERYQQLRADVARQMEYEWRQDAALVQLRSQIDNLEKQLRVATDEEHYLRTQMDTHRCEAGVGMHAGTFPLAPGTGIVPTSGAGTFRPQADGLFFINVDPVQLNCELDILKLTFTNEYLFTGHANGFVSIWDMTAPKHPLLRTLREHTGRITDLCAGPTQLLTASSDSLVRRWDLTHGRCTSTLAAHQGPVRCMHLDDARLVTGGQDTYIHVWDLERGQSVSALRGHHGAVVDLKFQGDMMVSVEWGWALFWDLRSSKIVRSLRDDLGGITCLDFKDGVAVAGGCGGDITVWDVMRGVGETIAGHDDDVLCVQLAGKSCITSGGDYKIRMWDLAAMKSLGVFHESHPYETKSFHVEGKRFVAAQGQFAKIWSK